MNKVGFGWTKKQIIVTVIIVIAIISLISYGAFMVTKEKAHILVHEVIENEQSIISPGFFLETGRGSSFYKTEVYQIGGVYGDLNSEMRLGYGIFYPEAALVRLADHGFDEDYGQLFFYDKYQQGEIFIFNNWYDKEAFYRVFYLCNGQAREYRVPALTYESLNGYVFTGDKVYLCRSEGWKEMISELDLPSGEVNEMGYSIPSGHKTFLNGNFFFQETKSRLRIISINDEKPILSNDFWKGVSVYDFNNYTYKYIETDILYDYAFLTSDGNYALFGCLPSESGFRLDTYSPNLELISSDIIPFTSGMEFNDQQFNEISSLNVYVIDGTLYGCICHKANEYYYYTVDLQTLQIMSLYELEINNNLPDDNYRILCWKPYLAGTDISPLY